MGRRPEHVRDDVYEVADFEIGDWFWSDVEGRVVTVVEVVGQRELPFGEVNLFVRAE